MEEAINHIFGDGLPIQVRAIPIFDLPSSDDDGASVHINFKMPSHWRQMIDEIREKVHTNLPDVWKTDSACYRWLMMQGILALQQIQEQLDSPEAVLSDDVQARLFLERTVGPIRAKGEIISQTLADVKALGENVDTLMRLSEDIEAANLINTWLTGASSQMSPFYRSFFITALLDSSVLADNMRVLTERGHVLDERIVELLEERIDTPHLLHIGKDAADDDSDPPTQRFEDSPGELGMAQGPA